MGNGYKVHFHYTVIKKNEADLYVLHGTQYRVMNDFFKCISPTLHSFQKNI